MKRICILLLLLLAACNGTQTDSEMPSNGVQTPLADAQSAVINLNIFNRDASLAALPADSDLLLVGDVGDRNAVAYTESIDGQSFITLSDNPDRTNENFWSIQTSRLLPISYVVDVTSGEFSADLSGLTVSRFDLVGDTATVEILFPASTFQMALDSITGIVNATVPANARVTSAQITNNGGLMTLALADSVDLSGVLTVTSGGMTITVPSATGVQILVDGAENSEITLPDNPRSVAEPGIYTTPGFDSSNTKVILTTTLSGATLRIVQKD